MKKNTVFVLILVLILAAGVSAQAVFSSGDSLLLAQDGLDMPFTLVLKKGTDAGYMKDLDEVLGTRSAPVKNCANAYNVIVNDDPRTEDAWLVVFNNLPAVEKVNGQPAKKALEKDDFPKPRNSMERVVPDSLESSTGSPGYAQGEVLLKLRSRAPKGMIEKINRVYGTTTIKLITGIHVYHLRIPKGMSTKTYTRILNMSPHVEYAELNKEMHIMQ